MIAVADLHKAFGSLRVLEGVSWALRPGRIAGLVGPNASGKSTLIKIILGLVRADRGYVLVDGVPAGADGGYRARIGYMPQAARFPAHLTPAEVLALLAGLRGPSAPRDDTLLDALGIAHVLDRAVGTLSGGTRQKLNAAVAFLFHPDVLILDEPTAGLDPVAAGHLKAAVRAAREAGRTVLVTSHVLAELQELCDDVAFLHEGRLRFCGPREELLARTGRPGLEGAIAALLSAPERVA